MNAGNVYPADSREHAIQFATLIVGQRVTGFKKDIDICLTPNAQGDHAYLPGLMTTISFLDLLAALYVGRVRDNNDNEFVRFIGDLMPGKYQEDDLRVLYIAFRHKLAHLSHPYFVLNTGKERRLKRQAPMLLTWTITSERPPPPPISIEKLPQPMRLENQPVPWETYYDHRMHISVRALADDAIAMSNAYLNELKSDPTLWLKFRGCLCELFQT